MTKKQNNCFKEDITEGRLKNFTASYRIRLKVNLNNPVQNNAPLQCLRLKRKRRLLKIATTTHNNTGQIFRKRMCLFRECVYWHHFSGSLYGHSNQNVQPYALIKLTFPRQSTNWNRDRSTKGGEKRCRMLTPVSIATVVTHVSRARKKKKRRDQQVDG